VASAINCYFNIISKFLSMLSHRYVFSINSLVAIIRKIELDPNVQKWTPGKLAATLIHRFRFDGIRYDRCIDTSTGALPFKLDMQTEFPKMALVWELISGEREDFPDNVISQQERVSLTKNQFSRNFTYLLLLVSRPCIKMGDRLTVNKNSYLCILIHFKATVIIMDISFC
jgi:hypothetical protein